MLDAYAPSLGLVLRRDTTAARQQRSPTLSSANAHVSDNPQADARRRTAGRQAEDCLRREGELSTHLRPSATSNSDRAHVLKRTSSIRVDRHKHASVAGRSRAA